MSPAELLRVHLGKFEIDEVKSASLLGSLCHELIRRWEVAVERAATREGMPDETRCWLQAKLGDLARQPSDEMRALAAEVDAALRLSWLGPVARLPEGNRQQCCGWFRGVQKVAAAIVSVRDGVVLFENPWALHPLSRAQRDELLRPSELRPEFSWFGPHVETDVAATLCRMVLLAELNGQEASA